MNIDGNDEGVEEEYYARRAKIERRFFNNRTGRRTRNRSGPGPPDPNRRVPFDPDLFVDGENSVQPAQHLNLPSRPPRMLSKFVFGGDPTPSNPIYEPGSLLSQLDAQQDDNRVTIPVGTVAESAEGRRNSNGSPTPTQCEQIVRKETVEIVKHFKKSEVNITASTSSVEQFGKEARTLKSKLTLHLERKMNGRSRMREVLASTEVTASDKIKMEVAKVLVCCKCKRNFAPPILGCIRGHSMCSLCQRECVVPCRPDKRFRFRCPICDEVGVPVEMRRIDALLQDLQYVCYCGLKVSGSQLSAHQSCLNLKDYAPKHFLVCEDHGANSCEFCDAEVIYTKYVDHLLRGHFLRIFPELSNKELIRWPRQDPLVQCELRLPLEAASCKMSVLPSILTQTIAECGDGKFTIHQVRFEEKQLTWCFSFEPPPAATRVCAAQFQVKLQFEAVVKNRLYRKICHALVYPFGKDMDEEIFLELVSRALPDAWTPTFKFAYTHKAILKLQIFRSTGKYVRRCGRTLEIRGHCDD